MSVAVSVVQGIGVELEVNTHDLTAADMSACGEGLVGSESYCRWT